MLNGRLLSGLIIIACWGCGDAPLGEPGPDAGPDAEPVDPEVFCDEAGTYTAIASGSVTGMDASRVFFRDGDTLKTWPKAGGRVVPFPRQDLGSRFTLSGDRYYWPRATEVVVTNELGETLATAQLATTNQIVELVAANGGGVYIRTQCLSDQSQPCPSPSPPDTIEFLASDSSAAQPVITATAPIRAMAAGADALIWLERGESSAPGVIKKWQPSTGATTLVDPIMDVSNSPETMVIDGLEFLHTARLADPFTPLRIQRRSLETGALIGSYPTAVPSRPSSDANHLRLDDQLYWTESSVLVGPSSQGICLHATGLFRMPRTGGPAQSLDSTAANEPIFVDANHVFYTYRRESYCCFGNGHTCPPPPPTPPEVRCYRK